MSRPPATAVLVLSAVVLGLASCATRTDISQRELAQVYWDLGRAFRGTGDYEKAADYLSRAATLDPDLTAARVELAETYVRSEKTAEAAAILERLPSPEDQNLLVVELLAYVRLQQGRAADAAAILRPRRTELGPAGYGNLLTALYRSGNIEEGAAYLGEVPADWFSNNDYLRALRALYLLEAGERDEAVRALESLPPAAEPYFRLKLADIYAEDGSYLQEVKLLESLYAELDGSLSIASRLALRYANELGDPASARTWADRAANLDAETGAELLKQIGAP